MINKVGRDIPDEILERYGKEGYNGPDYRNGTYYVKAAPRVRSRMEGSGKILPSLQEALLKCGVRDGMVLSFHHHFRDRGGSCNRNPVVGSARKNRGGHIGRQA